MLCVSAFPDLLDDLCAEGIEVARITRGDDAVIDYHLGIFPFRAGVDDVRVDGPVRGHFAAVGDSWKFFTDRPQVEAGFVPGKTSGEVSGNSLISSTRQSAPGR